MAEGARLESVCTRKGTQGSNPCLSAIIFNNLRKLLPTSKYESVSLFSATRTYAHAPAPGLDRLVSAGNEQRLKYSARHPSRLPLPDAIQTREHDYAACPLHQQPGGLTANSKSCRQRVCGQKPSSHYRTLCTMIVAGTCKEIGAVATIGRGQREGVSMQLPNYAERAHRARLVKLLCKGRCSSPHYS